MDFQKIGIFRAYEKKQEDNVELEASIGKFSKCIQKARWQVFINNQPKVMQTIIANDGGRTKY